MKIVRLRSTGLFILFSLISQFAYSQWESAQINAHLSLPEVALIDIEPGINNDIHFVVNPDSESGGSPSIQETTGNDLWINYTSALPPTQNSRSVTAEISQGNFPEGIILYVEASVYSGSGEGQFGQPTGKTVISNQPRPIISNIGNCYTGNGISNGHLLSFSIEIEDYGKIQTMGDSEFTIIYTITDN